MIQEIPQDSYSVAEQPRHCKAFRIFFQKLPSGPVFSCGAQALVLYYYTKLVLSSQGRGLAHEDIFFMETGLQKANSWKRISAFIFDGILLVTLAVGLGTLLSVVMDYNAISRRMDEAFQRYEQEYGITFSITETDYKGFSAEEKQRYDEAYQALTADGEAMALYQRVVNLMLLLVSLSILGAYMILEFALPLGLGHGRTLGKKIFGLGVMAENSIKIAPLQLFARTLLGKYAVETMVPVYVLTMLFFNQIGLFGTALLFLLLLAQLVVFISSRKGALLHDKLAGTVVVDYATQMIYDSQEARLEAQKKAAAEQNAHREW